MNYISLSTIDILIFFVSFDVSLVNCVSSRIFLNYLYFQFYLNKIVITCNYYPFTLISVVCVFSDLFLFVFFHHVVCFSLFLYVCMCGELIFRIFLPLLGLPTLENNTLNAQLNLNFR